MNLLGKLVPKLYFLNITGIKIGKIKYFCENHKPKLTKWTHLNAFRLNQTFEFDSIFSCYLHLTLTGDLNIYLHFSKIFEGVRPVARGGGCRVCDAPPNLPKGPLLVTKWAKNGGFCRRVRGVRFKKVHFFGVPHPPKSILAMGLEGVYPGVLALYAVWFGLAINGTKFREKQTMLNFITYFENGCDVNAHFYNASVLIDGPHLL